MTKDERIPKEWCFVAGIIGGTICTILSLINIFFIISEVYVSNVNLTNSMIIIIASSSAIYISRIKIVREKFFISAMVIGTVCLLLGIGSSYFLLNKINLELALMFHAIAILIATIIAIYISYIKIRKMGEPYFAAPLTGGLIGMVSSVVSMLFIYQMNDLDLVPLFISISILAASVPTVYVPSHKFRLGIIKLPWK